MFKIVNNRISYFPVSREKVEESDRWTFDYFTQEVLNKSPESGIRFEIEDNQQTTRIWVESTHCVKSWAGGDVEPDENEWKEHCWTRVVFLPEMDTGQNESGGTGNDFWKDNNGGGGGGYSPEPTEVIPDKSLDDPQYKNVKDVFDCIVMNAPSDFVKNMLNRFYGKNAEFDITYKVGEMPARFENATGLCDFSASGASGYKDGVITFNKNKLNASSVELISTLMHETLHAYIHSYLYSKDPSLKKTTLDEAFNLYEEKLKKGATAAQEHNFMAANWVNTLANELQQFHSTQESYERFWNYVNIADKNDRKLFYEAMAWSGLTETNAYKNLSPEYKTKMNNIFSKNKESLPISWKCN